MIPFVGIFIKLLEKVPGKIGGLTIKAFGNSSYDMSMSEYNEEYCRKCEKHNLEIIKNYTIEQMARKHIELLRKIEG